MIFSVAVMDGQPVTLVPCTVVPRKRKTRRPRLAAADPMHAFEAELKAMLRGASSGDIKDFLRCEPAMDALRICQRQTTSLRRPSRVAVGR